MRDAPRRGTADLQDLRDQYRDEVEAKTRCSLEIFASIGCAVVSVDSEGRVERWPVGPSARVRRMWSLQVLGRSALRLLSYGCAPFAFISFFLVADPRIRWVGLGTLVGSIAAGVLLSMLARRGASKAMVDKFESFAATLVATLIVGAATGTVVGAFAYVLADAVFKHPYELVVAGAGVAWGLFHVARSQWDDLSRCLALPAPGSGP